MSRPRWPERPGRIVRNLCIRKVRPPLVTRSWWKKMGPGELRRIATAEASREGQGGEQREAAGGQVEGALGHGLRAAEAHRAQRQGDHGADLVRGQPGAEHVRSCWTRRARGRPAGGRPGTRTRGSSGGTRVEATNRQSTDWSTISSRSWSIPPRTGRVSRRCLERRAAGHSPRGRNPEPGAASAWASWTASRSAALAERWRGPRERWSSSLSRPSGGPEDRRAAEDLDDEARVVAEVPPPQAGGLATQAVEPLQARPLHPRGCLRQRPAWMSKAAPTPSRALASQAADVRRHPALLLGGAEADPDQVGSGALIRSTIASSSSGVSGRNGGDQVPATRSPGKRAVSRSASSSGTPSRRRRRTTTSRARPRSGTDREHQVGAVHALASAHARPMAGPHHRHAVRGGEARGVVDATQLRVAPAPP